MYACAEGHSRFLKKLIICYLIRMIYKWLGGLFNWSQLIRIRCHVEVSHQDDLGCHPISSGWHTMPLEVVHITHIDVLSPDDLCPMQYLIRTTQCTTLTNPYDLWLLAYVIQITHHTTLRHPYLLTWGGILSKSVTTNPLCHTGNIRSQPQSSHPDEIAGVFQFLTTHGGPSAPPYGVPA